MADRSLLFAELIALRALSELDQLEEGYLWCMGSGDPEAVATGIRLLGSHLALTLRDLQVAMVVSDSELALSTPPALVDPCQRDVNGARAVNATTTRDSAS